MIEYLKDWKVQFLILSVFIALYIITKSPIIGVLTVLFLIFAFIVEVKENAKEKGWKEELKDLVILFVGIFLFIKVLGFLLNTEAPLSAIPTCSMEPTYSRGDVIVAQGAPIKTHYFNGTFSFPPSIYYNGTPVDIDAPIWSYCKSNPFSPICSDFRTCPTCFKEQYGDLTLYYNFCNRSNGKLFQQEICTSHYEINGKNYSFDYNTDTVIYAPKPGTLFAPYGLVVHRALLALCNETQCLYLTKGDNNNVFDFQYFFRGMANVPPSEKEIVGKVIFDIPYLGYPRIFLSGFVTEDPRCSLVLRYQNST